MNKKGLAIVTGASRGIGEAVAVGLAEDGYRVVLIARDEKRLDSVRNAILKLPGAPPEPIVLPADVTEHKKLQQEIFDIHQKHGPIDILVNSAGIFLDGSLDESIDNFKKILEINLVAPYALMQTIVEIMKAQKSGYIFNIASRAGKYGFSGGGVYGATKFALVGLTESLYRELPPLGIRITSLCPGWVNTEMAQEAGTPVAEEEMIQPEDIFKTIRFLLNLSGDVCVREIVLEMKKSIVY